MRRQKNAPAATGAAQRRVTRPIQQRRHYTAFREIRRVLRDIRTGALPLREIPRFLRWLAGGAA